jgi:hydrogenase maturation protease
MGHEKKQIEVLVLGLGNELLTDDGVGVHAARKLQHELQMEGVVIAQVGTAILHAQYLLEQAACVIAIDAVRAGDKPGSIYRFDINQARLNQPASFHDLGIVGVMRLIPQQDRPTVTILGIEPETMDFGMELSLAVGAAVPRVVRIAREMITEILSRKAGCSAGLVINELNISL